MIEIRMMCLKWSHLTMHHYAYFVQENDLWDLILILHNITYLMLIVDSFIRIIIYLRKNILTQINDNHSFYKINFE